MGLANNTPTSTHGANGAGVKPANTTANQGSMVEPRARVDTANTEEMFLSPRVLDAGAFARYSEMLKTIIVQASAQGRTLEDFSTDAEAMVKRCHDAGETINKRLQAGIRMLKMIDERAERTDLLLDKVQRSLPDSATLGAQIDAIVNERLQASQQRLDAVVAGAESRARAAEKRAIDAVALSEKHAARLEELGSVIEERLGTLENRLDESRTVVNDSVEALRRQVSEAQSRIDASIGAVLTRAEETGAGLSGRIEEAVSMTQARLIELDKSIEPVIEASSRAMRSLGMDPENPVFEDSPLARIEHLVDRGETQLASLDRVYRQLDDLQSQAEGVRSVFGAWLVSAAQELDTLEERKDHIVGPMSEAARLITELGPDVEQKLELASTQLTHLQIEQQTLRQTIQASSSLAGEVTDRMSNHSGQLQALLDGSLHRLSTRVEQAGVWLGALIQRAESLGTALPGAGSLHLDQAEPGQIESGRAGLDQGTPMAHQPTPRSEPRYPQTPPAAPERIEHTPPTFPTSPTTTTQATPMPSAERQAGVNQTAEHQTAGSQSTGDPSLKNPSSGSRGAPTPSEINASQIPMTSFTIPRPPQLPIDGLSFDGAARVIPHLREQA